MSKATKLDGPITCRALLAALGRVEDRANTVCLHADATSQEFVVARAMSELCQQLAAELAGECEQ